MKVSFQVCITSFTLLEKKFSKEGRVTIFTGKIYVFQLCLSKLVLLIISLADFERPVEINSFHLWTPFTESIFFNIYGIIINIPVIILSSSK